VQDAGGGKPFTPVPQPLLFCWFPGEGRQGEDAEPFHNGEGMRAEHKSNALPLEDLAEVSSHSRRPPWSLSSA